MFLLVLPLLVQALHRYFASKARYQIQQSRIWHYKDQQATLLLDPCGSQVTDVNVWVDPTNLGDKEYLTLHVHQIRPESNFYEELCEARIDRKCPTRVRFQLPSPIDGWSTNPLWVTIDASVTAEAATVPLCLSVGLQGAPSKNFIRI